MDMPQSQPSPQQTEAFQLVVARTREALSKVGRDLDSALRADPVQGAVEFGTRALRAVAEAARQAGKPLPFEILFGAGMQIAKDLAGIAMEKGYLSEGEVETFLKEVVQQSVQAYTKMDMGDGLISGDDAAMIQQKLGSADAGPPPPQGVLAGAA